jgi:hypothetical protein
LPAETSRKHGGNNGCSTWNSLFYDKKQPIFKTKCVVYFPSEIRPVAVDAPDVGHATRLARRIRPMKIRALICSLVAAFALAGCNDRASVKRIADRNERVRRQLADFQKMEADRPRRLNDAANTVNDAWIRDCKRFQDRSARVGDYFW